MYAFILLLTYQHAFLHTYTCSTFVYVYILQFYSYIKTYIKTYVHADKQNIQVITWELLHL